MYYYYCYEYIFKMSVLLRGYLLQLKRDNGVWNAFWNSKALPKQKISYCAGIYNRVREI